MERAKATPEDFGLAVRSHPSSLLVTARNKIGAGQKHILVGLSNTFVETACIDARPTSLEANRETARRLLEHLDRNSAVKVSGGFLVKGVPVGVIDEFILNFRNSGSNTLTETEPLRRYVGDRAIDELREWDVLVTSVNEKDELSDVLGWPVGPLKRGIGDGSDTSAEIIAISGKRMRFASRGVERVGVNDEKADAAERQYLLDQRIQPGKRPNFPDRIYRSVRDRPLLIFSLVKIEPSEAALEKAGVGVIPSEPVIAWGISFPKSAKVHSRVEYIINPTKYHEMFGEEDIDEDEEVEDYD